MRNAADVEKLMELPVIGLTPQLTGKDGNLPKLTHIYPLSAVAESYRILRTNVLFALRDTPFKTLMVATGRPGQGATTTICNLAIALAQAGKRIILIDADMRRPSLHKFFGFANDTGLSTLLEDKCKLTDAFRKTDIDNLIVIPGGPQPLNPSELLGSGRMQEIVGLLEEHCDLVLFDTPSTVVFSDGPMLASWIDAVIMVVSANQAPRGTEVQTRDLLRRAKANILGVVVNRMQQDMVDSCFYYSHYYADAVPKSHLELTGNNGNGNGNGKGGGGSAGPKAIPAETQAAGVEVAGENPFPD
jgi:protein-tyrosine kinase